MKITSRAVALANKVRTFFEPEDSLLRTVRGVIHVGANAGQEREVYARYDLPVIWIEPIPAVYRRLCNNLSGFPRQRAYNHLITDRHDAEYKFYIASNGGASSSVFEFARHTELYPEISTTDTALLRSVTLTSLVRAERIDLNIFDGLILDTQGSELLVLKGANDILPAFRAVKVEAADFESYRSGCRAADVTKYMLQYGFRETQRRVMRTRCDVGTYYDIVYQRK